MLFPADSKYPNTQQVGIRLLEQAKKNVEEWRDLPDKVLFEYARLCRKEELAQEKMFQKE